MKWIKYVLIVLAPLLAIAVALPFFISLDDYIPQIEQEISARFEESVIHQKHQVNRVAIAAYHGRCHHHRPCR